MGDGLRFGWHFSLPTQVYSRIRQRQAGDCVIPKTIQRGGILCTWSSEGYLLNDNDNDDDTDYDGDSK